MRRQIGLNGDTPSVAIVSAWCKGRTEAALLLIEGPISTPRAMLMAAPRPQQGEDSGRDMAVTRQYGSREAIIALGVDVDALVDEQQRGLSAALTACSYSPSAMECH